MKMENSKVAIITGGASGIGLATAKKLAGYGVNVVLADWNDNVEEIASNIGENALGIKCDVSNEESVKSLVEETVSKFGHIDYLVANGKMPDEDEDTNYEAMSVTKLKEIAKEKGIKNYSKMNKAELLKELDS